MPLLVNRAADLLDTGDAVSAEQLSREALRLAPDCAEAFSNLAHALLLQDRLDEAQQAAKKATEIQPLYPGAWHNLAEVFLKRGDPRVALEYADRALMILPTLSKTWVSRGSALMMVDRFVEAQACFERALSLEPMLNTARLNRNVAYVMADASRRSVLYQLVGLASELESGSMDQQKALESVVNLRSQDGVDATLVAALDSFVQVNLSQGRSLAAPLSLLNHKLALDTGDPDLIDTTRRTQEAATA
ncbi:tetratricopeptide repeat protein [Mesorhizobium sp.]|uniref:tetratricopeptide repeat protein n=1 Tax=Mesorhizobium sp. TaxID=1871066 RepID=UPI00257EC0FA|nr:tetratricopeptide repeat protein [Mesorhizobium sp.]